MSTLKLLTPRTIAVSVGDVRIRRDHNTPGIWWVDDRFGGSHRFETSAYALTFFRGLLTVDERAAVHDWATGANGTREFVSVRILKR